MVRWAAFSKHNSGRERASIGLEQRWVARLRRRYVEERGCNGERGGKGSEKKVKKIKT